MHREQRMASHLVIEGRRSDGDVILTWQFVEAPGRRFYWRALAADGAVTQQSRTTFASLEACAADASRAWAAAPGKA